MFNNKIMATVGISAIALTMSATDTYAAEKGTVTASALNVRSGNSTNHSIISKLYKGDTVDILDSSNGWYKIKLSNGKTGWVSGKYISKSSSSTNPEQSASGYGKVTASTLNVRSGPSTKNSVISKLSKNTTVELISSSNGWYKVKLSNGKTGWVSGQYITKTSSPSTSKPEQSTSGYGKVTASTLNVRSGPSTKNSIISKLYKNDTVKLVSSSNGWYKVELSNKKTGWVSGDYITKTSSPSTSNPSSSVQAKRDKVVSVAKSKLGKPYLYGAEGPNSFDCSGLAYYVYKNAVGVTLPRTSTQQSTYGTTVSKSSLQPGDLMFFATAGGSRVSHVGIYIGNGDMIHAPGSGRVVTTVDVNTSYWNNTFVTAKRIIK